MIFKWDFYMKRLDVFLESVSGLGLPKSKMGAIRELAEACLDCSEGDGYYVDDDSGDDARNGYVITADIPEWAVPAIEYGDYSGLSDEDIAQVKDFREKYHDHTFQWNFDNVNGFNRHPAFGLATRTIPCRIYNIGVKTADDDGE